MVTRIKPSQITGYVTTDYVTSYAQADALKSSRAEGALFFVDSDENEGGQSTRYVLSGGVLTLQAGLLAANVKTSGGLSVEDALAAVGSPAVADLSDVSGPGTANKQILQYDLVNELWVPTTPKFDVVVSQFGTLEANAILFNFIPGVALKLPANLTDSSIYSEVAATNSSAFSLKKNGVQIGLVTFTPGSNVGTISSSPEASILATDKLSLVAPATADATLASVSFRIRFYEV